MVQVSGKYRLVSNNNFLEQLLAMGVPEEKAKTLADEKPETEIVINGNDVTITSNSALHKAPSKWILGQEIDETMPHGGVLKSTATLEGDTLSIISKREDGKTGSRVFKFDDKGFVLTVTSSIHQAPVATRTYVRI